MVRRRLALLLLVLLLPAVGGCWDRRDPEKVAWVTAIGIDKGEGGDYEITFQVPIARQIGPGGGGGGGGGGQAGAAEAINVFTVRAPDIVTAMASSQSFVSRRLTLAHAKAVVLGADLTGEDIRRVLYAATRYTDFRRSMLVLVSRSGAREFLELAKPRMELHPARWFEQLELVSRDTANVPMTRLHQLAVDMERAGLGARATLVAIRTEESPSVGEGQSEGDVDQGWLDVYPGQVVRKGQLPVEVLGTAVLRSTEISQYLTGRETRVLTILRGELRQFVGNMPDPLSPGDEVNLNVTQVRRPRVTVRRRGDRVTVHFDVALLAQMQSQESTVNYADPQRRRQLEEAGERAVKAQAEKLLKKALGEWRADLFMIGHRLLPTFSTYQEWVHWDWPEKMADADVTVSVHVQVERLGMQTAPPPLRP